MDASTLTRTEAAILSSTDLRQAIKREEWTENTLGLGLGRLQANLAVVPKEDAYDFLLFCQRNPKPCPLIEVLDVGSPIVQMAAKGADLRDELPRYRVFRNGEPVSDPYNLHDVWEDDAVAFLLGCSLTFESALLQSDIPLRHLEAGVAAPVYTTSVQCASAGKFSGPMVVSMRPIPADQVARAVQVTARYPWGHGAPVHIGDPEALGIKDLDAVDFGACPVMKPGDVPVFWGCGITPQLAAESAKSRYMFTHYAQHMFVSDRSSEADAVA